MLPPPRIIVCVLFALFLCWNFIPIFQSKQDPAPINSAPSSSLFAASSPNDTSTLSPSPPNTTSRNKGKKKKRPKRSYLDPSVTHVPNSTPTTHLSASHIVFVDEATGSSWDLQLDVRPENDLLLQAQSVPESLRIERLQAWLTRNGARFNGFEFRLIAPEYRGLFSTRDLQSGVEFIFIPSFLLLNSKQWSHNAIGYLIRNKKLDFQTSDYDDIFIWWLLIERFNPNSYWKLWIPTLPMKYASHPYFWDRGSLEWLKGSQTLAYVMKAKREHGTKYNDYINLIPLLKAFSFEQFLWATVAVWSRVWGDSEGDTGCPLMDMINHSPRAISHQWDDNGMGFWTSEAVPNGTQMYLDYGHRSQLEWFSHYGFTNPNNELDNTLTLHLELDPSDPLHDDKMVVLGYSNFDCELSLTYDTTSTSRWCYSFARVRAYSGVDLTVLKEHTEPISFANELNALRYLAGEANKSLSKFPTTYEEDLKILGGNPNLISTDFNYYNALVVRTAEKQLLLHVVGLFNLLDSLNLELGPLLSNYDKSIPGSVSKLDSAVRVWTGLDMTNEFSKTYMDSVLLSLFPELTAKPELA